MPGLFLMTAIAILLSACSTATPGSGTAQTTEPPSTTSASPSKSSAPSPSSSFDTANPSTWLITETGIGPVEIGSYSAADALSPSFVQADWCEGLEFFDSSGAYPVGFGVISHPGKGGVGGIGIRMPGNIAVTGPVEESPLTESGIGLGSSLADLTTAEPNGAFETGVEWPKYVVSAGARWILFEVSESEPFVRGITVTEQLPPAGFCG